MLLIIGNKRYSSWSLRPWLLLRHFDIPFREQLIPLDQPETKAQILKYSPTGKVPALVDGNVTVWESLAIAEYLHEKFPARGMWPKDARARAYARSVASEMHAGFQTMRQHMPHDLQTNLRTFDWTPAKADVERVFAMWTQYLQESGGPFLFGSFCIADAMFAPVVNRLVSYGVPCDEVTRGYVRAIRTLPAHQEWLRAGTEETLISQFH